MRPSASKLRFYIQKLAPPLVTSSLEGHVSGRRGWKLLAGSFLTRTDDRPSYYFNRSLASRFASASSPAQSSSTGATQTVLNPDHEERRRTLNRLLYRSRQRGFLELDLIVGKWAEEHIHTLDDKHLTALVAVLEQENPELWKWLTGQEAPPSDLSGNPVFMAMHQEIMGSLSTHSAAETRARPTQPWVSGWNDKSVTGGPRTGNQ